MTSCWSQPTQVCGGKEARDTQYAALDIALLISSNMFMAQILRVAGQIIPGLGGGEGHELHSTTHATYLVLVVGNPVILGLYWESPVDTQQLAQAYLVVQAEGSLRCQALVEADEGVAGRAARGLVLQFCTRG